MKGSDWSCLQFLRILIHVTSLWPVLSFSFSLPSFRSSLPGGLQVFRGFLRSEFSEENLEFWLACEDYRVSPSKTKASSIYGQFINPDAPQEVGRDESVM